MTISPINLGSFYTNSNGASVASGLSSGLNTDALITALTASQTAQVTALQDQVTVNNGQSTALNSLSQILSNLQTALTPLSNPNNPDTTNNLFAVRTSNITSNTSQDASNYLTATVASGTASGTYTISNITQLATKTTQETGAFTLASATDSVVPATPTAGYFNPGTITIKGQNITIHQGDNLATIAQSFNTVSGTTGISASVLQTSAGKYKLIFTSTTTGAAANFDLSSSGTVTDTSGVLSGLAFQTDTTALDAQFKLNNVSVSRPSNNISDLVSGVTINLLQNTTATPNASFTIQVAPDTASIASGISNFATAYNNFLYFYSQQTQIDSTTGKPATTAVLYSDTTLRNIYNSVSGIAASLVKGIASGQPNTLAGVGITFTDFAGNSTIPATANTLSVDTSTLQSLLSTNFTGVENVLGDSFNSSSPYLTLYASPTNLTVNSFTLNVANSANPPTYTASYVDANNATQTVALTATSLYGGGISLSAPSDSVLSGMQLVYSSSGDESGITVSISKGILSSLNTTVTAAVKSSNGLIANDQQSITDKNTALQTQITTVTNQTNTLRDSLLQKYSQLEAAIAKANSVLNLLNAQQLAGQSSG